MTEIIIAALLGVFAGFALASVLGVRNLRQLRDERDAARLGWEREKEAQP